MLNTRKGLNQIEVNCSDSSKSHSIYYDASTFIFDTEVNYKWFEFLETIRFVVVVGGHIGWTSRWRKTGKTLFVHE